MKIKKIIRDKVALNAAQEDGTMLPVVHVDDNKAIELLLNKLDEEINEFKAEIEKQKQNDVFDTSPVMLEAADIEEVLYAIISKIKRTTKFKSGTVTCRSEAMSLKQRLGKFDNNLCLLDIEE